MFGPRHIDPPSLPSIPSEKTLSDFSLRGQQNYAHITDVNNSKRSKTADPGNQERPARRRGRPPLPAGEAKRFPLTIRTTKAQKDELLRASKAAGRSLAEEIDFRLGAVRARPAAAGNIDQIRAGLDHVLEMIGQLRTDLDDIENWVYGITVELQNTAGVGGTELIWDGAEEKFMKRPAALAPIVRSEAEKQFVTPPDAEPKPPKPKPKSRRS